MPDSTPPRSPCPSRRSFLLTGAAIAVGGAAGSAATALYQASVQAPESDTPLTSDPTTDSTQSIWEERDTRFLKDLTSASRELPITATYRGAFPSLELRDVLPLKGLGTQTSPWIAATIVGPENQLQITRSDESRPSFTLNIPMQARSEILSMAWDPERRVLYLSSSGRLWVWRYTQPTTIVELADVPGASVLYELLVDPQGHVWGGTYPSGTVFRFDPSTSEVQVYSKFAEDSEYVRRLTLDRNGRFWAGTGSVNPRLFTFSRSSPEKREEIAHPDPVETGFIYALRAGPSKVLMTSDGRPDIFELDIATRAWRPRIRAQGWVRPPSSEILLDDTFYMQDGRTLLARTHASSGIVSEQSEPDRQAIHTLGDSLLTTGPVNGGFSLQTVYPDRNQTAEPVTVTLEPGRFRVQSLLAASDGMVYVGGFMGSGIAGIDPDTDERWRSPDDVQLIHQIENMIEYGPEQVYLGTYSWADVIRWNPGSRDDPSSYDRVTRLSSEFQQSRPFGLAVNSSSIFVGTVPDYGVSGGVLTKIDVKSDAVEWVLDGDGSGFVTAHSIVGLVADEQYVYGTTSVRNGLGTPDADGPARVFMFDIATRKKIWETAPVESAGALYSPLLVAGWLLVADIEGVNVIDPRNGRVEARHRLGPAQNSAQRSGWVSAEIALIDGGRRIVHAASGAITLIDVLSATKTRAHGTEFGTRVTVSAEGVIFTASHGTDVVAISSTQDASG